MSANPESTNGLKESCLQSPLVLEPVSNLRHNRALAMNAIELIQDVEPPVTMRRTLDYEGRGAYEAIGD